MVRKCRGAGRVMRCRDAGSRVRRCHEGGNRRLGMFTEPFME